MGAITRIDSNERLSRVVVHGDTVYVAGITSSVKGDVVAQTRDVFAKIDSHLASAGTDKHHLLTVQIWSNWRRLTCWSRSLCLLLKSNVKKEFCHCRHRSRSRRFNGCGNAGSRGHDSAGL